MSDNQETLRECPPPERIVVSYDPAGGIGLTPSKELARAAAFSDIEYARVHPVPPADAQEPSLEDLAMQAAIFLDLVSDEFARWSRSDAKHIAFALRQNVASARATPDALTEARRIVGNKIGIDDVREVFINDIAAALTARSASPDREAVIRECAVIADRFDHRHSSGYRCNSGEKIAKLILALITPTDK